MSTQNNNQLEKAPTKFDALRLFIAKDTVQDQLKNAVGDNADAFAASIIDLYTGDSYLQNCQPELVVMQSMKAAVLKLPVIKSLGFAYIVPYKSDGKLIPQLQIGYKGLIQLAIRTNQYRIIHTEEVYEGEYRSSNKLTGEFDLSGQKVSEKVIGYFAHFEMKSGFSKTLYMTKEKVEAHAKKYSKSYNQASSPWKTEFDAMAKKTVLRGLLAHWGYLSTEMIDTITNEDKDVAEQVLNEIQANGNARPMSFNNVPEAETINNHEPESARPF